jgi:hypothetical protein
MMTCPVRVNSKGYLYIEAIIELGGQSPWKSLCCYRWAESYGVTVHSFFWPFGDADGGSTSCYPGLFSDVHISNFLRLGHDGAHSKISRHNATSETPKPVDPRSLILYCDC